MIDTLKLYHSLIRINSTNGNEKSIIEYIDKQLRSMDLETNYIYHEMDQHRNSPSLYTTIQGKLPGKSIMLIGHVDTVDANEHWTTNPFEPVVIGNKTYGLGSMDMKGGLVSILKTLEYFSQNRDLFCGTIVGAFVSDEEYKSTGTFRLIEEQLGVDMAIMAEGRQELVLGFRGRYSIDITVKGVAKHSQYYPDKGESAIKKACQLGLAIESIKGIHHDKLGKGTYMIKHITGGQKNTLIVPDECQMIIEKFFVVGETFESIRDEILLTAKKLGYEKDIDIKLRNKETAYMEPFVVDTEEPLVEIMSDKYESVTGNKAKHVYDLSVCDSNIISRYWDIPVVTFGPSGEGLHSANEFGYHDQIDMCYEIYTQSIKSLLIEQDERMSV